MLDLKTITEVEVLVIVCDLTLKTGITNYKDLQNQQKVYPHECG